MSDIGSIHAFQRSGTWDFLDIGAAWLPTAPVGEQWIAWSIVPVDPDGDGRLGFIVTYGPLGAGEPYEPSQPDRYFAPLGEATAPRFEELPEAFDTPPPNNTRGAAVADLDEDGVPDLVLGAVDGPVAHYRGRCTAAARLVVELGDGVTDARTVGARVSVDSGGAVQTRELRAGGEGTFSASEPSLFFGLGDAGSIRQLSVRWADGSEDAFAVDCVNCRVTVPLP